MSKPQKFKFNLQNFFYKFNSLNKLKTQNDKSLFHKSLKLHQGK